MEREGERPPTSPTPSGVATAPAATDRVASPQQVLYLAGLASFLGPASIAIYLPSLVALRETFDTTNALAGATVSMFALGLAVAQLLYGPLVDRYSARTVLVTGLGLFVGASLLAAVAPNIGVFLLARGAQAAGAAAGFVVGGAFVSDRFPAERRAAAMGTLQMCNGLGSSTAPAIGSLIIALGFGWQVDFIALAVVGLLIAVGVAALFPRQQVRGERFSPGSILVVLSLAPTLAPALLGSVQFYTHISLMTFTPLVLRAQAGLEPQWIGLLLMAEPIGIAIGAPLGGRLADRWGRRRAALLSGALTVVVAAAYTALVAAQLGGAIVAPLALAQFSFGLAVGMGVAAQLALMVEWLPTRRGAAVGTYAAVRYLGAALGPLVGGLLLDRLPLASPFLAGTLLLLAATLLGARLLAEPPKAEG